MISLLFLSISGVFFAQNSPEIKISNRLYNHLVEEGFSPTKQLLAGEGNFPYSILLNYNNQTDNQNLEANRLIITMPQDMAQQYLQETVSLLKKMEAATISVTLALLANESPPFLGEESSLPDQQWHPSGSQILLENTPDADSCAIVMLENPSQPPKQVTVVPGANGMMTPLWLLQQLPLPIPHNSLITYRLNLVAENPVLAPFFEAGMAAVAVRLDYNQGEQAQEVFSAMEALIQNFTAVESSVGSSENYMVFSFLDNFWIGEEIFILLYLAIAILVLALLSGFSFLGKKGAANRQAFFRIWYLIPITILMSSLFLWLGQQVATLFVEATPENTITILGVKIIFSFITVSLPYIFHLRLRLNISQFVYGYLLTIVAAMNVFIFTSVDLVLLFIFVMEYIVIYFSRLARRVVPLVVASLLMLLPFVPYVLNILEYASWDKLLSLVYCGVWGNILFACILTPFQIMWLRILSRLDLFGTHRNISQLKMFAAVGLTMGAMLVSMILLISLGSLLLYRTIPSMRDSGTEKSPQGYLLVEELDPLPLNISVGQTGYLELRSVTVEIDSDLPVLRFDLEVHSPGGLPVYDSAMDFQTMQEDQGTEQVFVSRFLIPDYPAARNTLEYTADSSLEQTVKVTVYLEVGLNQAARIEKMVALPPLVAPSVALSDLAPAALEDN